jgi:hypothetical protein
MYKRKEPDTGSAQRNRDEIERQLLLAVEHGRMDYVRSTIRDSRTTITQNTLDSALLIAVKTCNTQVVKFLLTETDASAHRETIYMSTLAWNIYEKDNKNGALGWSRFAENNVDARGGFLILRMLIVDAGALLYPNEFSLPFLAVPLHQRMCVTLVNERLQNILGHTFRESQTAALPVCIIGIVANYASLSNWTEVKRYLMMQR